MRRPKDRRVAPVLEGLEGRHLQSGLAASTQGAPASLLLPHVEQGNPQPTDPGRAPGSGGESRIIAILIGL
ncbi:hypothetical protein [Tautonia plasticadhaerens]|uniref:Uncharacterized protein n=1 Tax=Tautonia plasticadhaerens TaxID=2527974 RepID=A0A518HCG8_9BACT|nr:hypothetical protein [Tautonia plasticadhaerens]QDV38551.1 hypothetical protein ElP_65060 [Tautonia plasticadhaerens]